MGIEIKPKRMSQQETIKMDEEVSSLVLRIVGFLVSTLSMSLFMRWFGYTSSLYQLGGFIFTMSFMIYEIFNAEIDEKDEEEYGLMPKYENPPAPPKRKKTAPLPNKFKKEPILKISPEEKEYLEYAKLQCDRGYEYRSFEDWKWGKSVDFALDDRVYKKIKEAERNGQRTFPINGEIRM